MTKTELLALLKADRTKRRYREQTGSVVKRSDGFYIRYYKDGDGGIRTKVTEHLCDLSVADPQKRKLLAKSHLSAINNTHHAALRSEAPAPVLTVGAFWDSTYLPWVKKNKRSSTLRGYQYVWQLYVKHELAIRPLNSYRTIDASEFLTDLAGGIGTPTGTLLNGKSLSHVRALMSGIFVLAVNTKGANGEAFADHNPIRDVKVLVNQGESKEMVAYTPEESIAIINAIKRTDAKLFFALCAVLAMRPSEAAAVTWENVTDGVLKVREAAPYGVLGALKTKKSKRDLTITEPVTSLLATYRESLTTPAQGLLFTSDGKKPINHNSFAKYYIKPYAMGVCARWSGCYSGRHGAATTLFNQDGDVRAAYQVLGNSLEVVMATYVKSDVEQGKAGQTKYEQALLKAMKKAEK
jgi:integrase